MRISYVVELLFSLVLFTVFVIGAFFILLFGANAYQNMVNTQQYQDENQMAIAYLSTKVQQAPSADGIQVVEIDGVTCLVVEEVINDKAYSTVVYYQDGALWELFTASDRVDIANATKVLNVTQVEMSEENSGYRFEIENVLGQSHVLVLYPR